ncbi:uncharacterized protein V6R79_008134 [Siganus canaliculatus]
MEDGRAIVKAELRHNIWQLERDLRKFNRFVPLKTFTSLTTRNGPIQIHSYKAEVKCKTRKALALPSQEAPGKEKREKTVMLNQTFPERFDEGCCSLFLVHDKSKLDTDL